MKLMGHCTWRTVSEYLSEQRTLIHADKLIPVWAQLQVFGHTKGSGAQSLRRALRVLEVRRERAVAVLVAGVEARGMSMTSMTRAV